MVDANGGAEEIINAASTLIPIDGDVSPQRISQLIQRDHEEDWLDFKRTWAARTKRMWAKLARDLAGMAQGEGGWIVVGLRENSAGSQPRYAREGIGTELVPLFEPTKIADKLRGYMSVTLNIRAAVVAVDGLQFGAVFVWPHPNEPIVMSTDADDDEDTPIFRAGDVLVRRGKSTRRADQTDMARIVKQYSEREAQRLFHQFGAVAPANPTPPESVDTLSADRAVVETRLQLLVRSGLDQGVVVDYRHGLAELRTTPQAAPIDELIGRAITYSDNAVTLAAVGLLYDKLVYARAGVQSLQSVYDLLLSRAPDTSYPQQPIAKGWLDVAARASAVGAALVRSAQFDAVPSLVDHEVAILNATWRWLRHAITMAARAKVLDRPSLVPPAVDLARDLHSLSLLFDSEDASIDAACQFDFIAQLRILLILGKGRSVYPSFGLYYAHRTRAVIDDLIRGGASRAALPSHVSDPELADAIQYLDRTARDAFFAQGVWDRGEWGPAINAFIQANASEDLRFGAPSKFDGY